MSQKEKKKGPKKEVSFFRKLFGDPETARQMKDEIQVGGVGGGDGGGDVVVGSSDVGKSLLSSHVPSTKLVTAIVTPTTSLTSSKSNGVIKGGGNDDDDDVIVVPVITMTTTEVKNPLQQENNAGNGNGNVNGGGNGVGNISPHHRGGGDDPLDCVVWDDTNHVLRVLSECPQQRWECFVATLALWGRREDAETYLRRGSQASGALQMQRLAQCVWRMRPWAWDNKKWWTQQYMQQHIHSINGTHTYYHQQQQQQKRTSGSMMKPLRPSGGDATLDWSSEGGNNKTTTESDEEREEEGFYELMQHVVLCAREDYVTLLSRMTTGFDALNIHFQPEEMHRFMKRFYGVGKRTSQCLLESMLNKSILNVVGENQMAVSDSGLALMRAHSSTTASFAAPAKVLRYTLSDNDVMSVGEEHARQLTLLMHALYVRINSAQLLFPFRRRDASPRDATDEEEVWKRSVAGLLFEMVQRLSTLCSTWILNGDVATMRQRAERVGQLGLWLAGNRNFCGAFGVGLGLQQHCVTRLWEGGDQNNVIPDALKSLVDPIRNYANYRKELESISSNTSCVPYIGVTKQGIAVMMEGWHVRGGDSKGFKLRLEGVWSVLNQFHRWQNAKYALVDIAPLQKWWIDQLQHAGDKWTNDDLYARSYQLKAAPKSQEQIN